MIDFERCTVSTSKNDDELREVQIELQDGEVRHDIEHIEPYGFSSEPYTDKKTDAIALFTDESHELGVVINVADRRFRVKSLKTGEVVIYDDKKRHVYLKQDGIEIDGADSPITVKTTDSVKVTAGKEVVVNAAQDITLSSSANININASGNVNISAGGLVNINGSGVNIG